jgi:hypothetical protein
VTARPPGWQPSVLIAGLTTAASAWSLANGFVYDDVPIILQNPLVHQLGSAGRIWHSGYWPAGLLYRPITSQLFALEWAVGGGSPLVFHLVSVLLAVATALAVWRLAVRVLPPVVAVLVASLFAVHPVHVEAVANVVGQAELLAALFALLAAERYIAWRTEGTLSPARRGGLAALTLFAILSKETGYVIPLLLAAAELTVVRAGNRRRASAGELAPAFVLQLSVVVGAILLRIIALGPTPAAGPAVALRSLAPGDRIVGMLAVVPQWVRLLVWPAHLQAEYGPPALAVTGVFGPAHLLGLVTLLGALALMAMTRRRHPAIAFGLAWTAIALLPVSNLLTATGVILAERTLFLPSVGTMLALGGAMELFLAHYDRPRARPALWAICGALAVLGAVLSARRQSVWRSEAVFFSQLERDAPRTYRAQLVASIHYSAAGRYPEAERTARRGLELYQGDPQLYKHLGQVLRVQRRCGEAIPILGEGVRRFPDRTIVRSRLIECTLAVGDTARARAAAAEAVRLGYTEFGATVRRLDPARTAVPATFDPKVPR